MTWLNNLEFEIEWRIREIIREHGGLIEVTDPKVNRLFQNLTWLKSKGAGAPKGGKP